MTEGLYKILINNCNTYLHKQTNFNLNYVIFSWPTSKLISSIKKMVIGSPTQPSSSCLFWIFVFCICVLRLAFRMPFFNLVVYPSILIYPFFFLIFSWEKGESITVVTVIGSHSPISSAEAVLQTSHQPAPRHRLFQILFGMLLNLVFNLRAEKITDQTSNDAQMVLIMTSHRSSPLNSHFRK